MKFWDILSEFIVFRWLFGSRRHHSAESAENDVDERADTPAYSDSLDSIVDEIVRRDTGGSSYKHSYDRSYDNSWSRNDSWDRGYSQSDEDFLDEQDEIDMMDDMF